MLAAVLPILAGLVFGLIAAYGWMIYSEPAPRAPPGRFNKTRVARRKTR